MEKETDPENRQWKAEVAGNGQGRCMKTWEGWWQGEGRQPEVQEHVHPGETGAGITSKSQRWTESWAQKSGEGKSGEARW